MRRRPILAPVLNLKPEAGRPRDAFGGSFMYPIEPNVLAVGLVVGLDYRQTTFDVHRSLQRM